MDMHGPDKVSGAHYRVGRLTDLFLLCRSVHWRMIGRCCFSKEN